MDSAVNVEDYYKVFHDLNASVQTETKVDEILNLIVKESAEALNAKGALIRVLNLETEHLELSAAYGLSERYLAKGPVSSHKTIISLYKENKISIIKNVVKRPESKRRPSKTINKFINN